VATACEPISMLRNFGMRKITLRRPTRSDQYKTGPGEVNRTAKEINTIGRAKHIAASRPAVKSNKRFKKTLSFNYLPE